MTKILAVTLIIIAAFSKPVAAQTDEFAGILKKAEALYAQGKLAEAIAHIQSKQMDQYETLFPAPLTGWKAEKVESQAMSAVVAGAGISMSRSYHTENGADLSITMVTDSPMMAGLLMAFGNPLVMGGNRVVTVNGEKATYEWDDDEMSGKIQIIVDRRVLITVEGSGLEKKDDLVAYANAIDFAKLRTLLKQ